MIYNKIIRNGWLSFLVFVMLAFVLYLPTINRSFVSDDFLILRRVVYERSFLMSGFFRPLSDLSLYLNFLLGGLNPAGYYIWGILLHGINSFLLFKFCQNWKWTSESLIQNRYALLAALLFLCYPFHNESIVWLLGRASSMASTCGILALYILVSGLRENLKVFLVCICYFIGLMSYESILLLPIMVVVIIYNGSNTHRKIVRWTMFMIITIILHLLVRRHFSGVIVGSYGESFFFTNPLHYLISVFKVTGRLFLPPVQNSTLFSIGTFFVLGIIIIVFISIWRRFNEKIYFCKIILLVVVTSIVPVLFSISTKTSESDRFLHFPSFFLCCGISIILVQFFRNSVWKLVWFSVLICSYFIFFLEKNNSNWIKASHITKDILTKINEVRNYPRIAIINLPDEINGAFIFRLGFNEALAINGIDSSGIKVVNHLKREEMILLPKTLTPYWKGDVAFIPPEVSIRKNANQTNVITVNEGLVSRFPESGTIILYWNNQELQTLRIKQ